MIERCLCSGKTSLAIPMETGCCSNNSGCMDYTFVQGVDEGTVDDGEWTLQASCHSIWMSAVLTDMLAYASLAACTPLATWLAAALPPPIDVGQLSMVMRV